MFDSIEYLLRFGGVLVKQHLIGLTVALITLSFGSGFELLSAYQVGELEARIDLLQGKRIYKSCGLGSPWIEETAEFTGIMQDRYNVEVVQMDSCPANLSSWERQDGYNLVQIAELEKIYGRGVVEKAQRQAADWVSMRNLGYRRQNRW
jgi:hypothetical protein